MTEELDIAELRKDALRRVGRDEMGKAIPKEIDPVESKLNRMIHDMMALREQMNEMVKAYGYMQKGVHDKLRDVEKAIERLK